MNTQEKNQFINDQMTHFWNHVNQFKPEECSWGTEAHLRKFTKLFFQGLADVITAANIAER